MMFSFVIVFFLNIGITCAGKDVMNVKNVCDTSLNLTEHGTDASVLFKLNANIEDDLKSCHIRITGPKSHLLYVRVTFPENSTQETADGIHCPVNVYQLDLQDEKPTFVADPCWDSYPSDGGLLSYDINVTWTPHQFVSETLLLVTVVGAGETCQQNNQHTCLQAGWTPLLCISKDLLCDGTVNCPTGDILADENPQYCRDRKSMSSTNWEKLATDFLKKITGKSRPSSLLPAIQKGDNTWITTSSSTTPNANSDESLEDADDSLRTTLAEYGPWGYLMLGLLLCGAVLTCCGLWECCCKRSKPPRRSHLTASPSNSTAAASTAVLMLGEPTSSPPTTVSPPRYDDLDQPPSYKSLFPESEQKNIVTIHTVR